MTEKSTIWKNGHHCGFLISKPPCPHPSDSPEALDWEEGFAAGRKQLLEDHRAWLAEQKRKKDGAAEDEEATSS